MWLIKCREWKERSDWTDNLTIQLWDGVLSWWEMTAVSLWSCEDETVREKCEGRGEVAAKADERVQTEVEEEELDGSILVKKQEGRWRDG